MASASEVNPIQIIHPSNHRPRIYEPDVSFFATHDLTDLMRFSFTKGRASSVFEMLEISVYVDENAIILLANVLTVEVDRNDRVPVSSKIRKPFKLLKLMLLNLVVWESRKMCSLTLEQEGIVRREVEEVTPLLDWCISSTIHDAH